MAPRGPKMAPKGPKMVPRWPKTVPRGPKMAPRRPQEGPKTAPRRSQEGPRFSKRPQDGPKRPQGGPNMASRTDLGSSWASGAAKNLVQDVSKSMFEAIEMAKRTLVEIRFSPRRGASFSHAKRCQKRPRGPKWPQDDPKRPQDGPKRPQDGLKRPQDGLKRLQDGLKMVPRESSLGLTPIDPRLGRQVSLPTPIGPRLGRQVSPTMAPGAPRARGLIIKNKHQPIQDLTRPGPKAWRINIGPLLKVDAR